MCAHAYSKHLRNMHTPRRHSKHAGIVHIMPCPGQGAYAFEHARIVFLSHAS